MAADLNKPDTTQTDTAVLTSIRDNDLQLAKLSGALSNLVADVIRFYGTNSRWEKWDGSAWVELIAKASGKYDINVDRVDGYDAGNSTGNVPVSNGTVNTNLNADTVDGYHAGTGVGQVLVLDGGGKVPAANLIASGVSASTYRSVTVDAAGRVTAGSNPTTITGYGLIDAAALAGSTSQAFGIANASARTQAARWEQVQDDATSSCVLSGTNTYTGTLAPVITAYATTHVYCTKFANASTSTTPTVSLNSVGALTLKRPDGTALRSGDLNGWHAWVYDGADAIVLNLAPRAAHGKQTVWIPAGAITPSASSGCASLATAPIGSGQPDLSYLAFDPTTQEYAQFAVRMPKSWDEGTVTFQAEWAHGAAVTNFGAAFSLEAVSFSDGESMAASFGTAVVVTDTGGTTNARYVTAESSAVTVAGSPAANDLVFFRFARVPANAGDTLALDASLLGVTLFLTTDTETDA